MEKLRNEELPRKSLREFKESRKIPVYIVLDNVRSALNVGSVFRTSDAFLISKLFLCGITAFPPNREIRKTALGSTESVEWEYCSDSVELIVRLKAESFQIVPVEQVRGAVSLQNLQLNIDKGLVLVFGHEVDGVGQEIIDQADYCLEIPQLGTKHSLNVGVAAGIVLWEVSRSMLP